MGKATIISGGTAGLYQVQVDYDRRRADAEIAAKQSEIATLDGLIATLQVDIDAVILDVDYVLQVFNAKLTAYQNDPNDSTKVALVAAQKSLHTAEQQLLGLQSQQRHARLSKVSAQKRIDYLTDQLPGSTQVAAWCADFNESLSGAVGTIEVGREGLPIIRPAGDLGDQAGYAAATDGQLQPVVSMTAASAFLNYALLPGVNKWMPRYRTGTITALDTAADTADVQLDAATSTHQSLDINQAASLSAVPVQYMICNAKAFTVGDQVVIEFTGQDWDQPKVVGFVHDPQPCELYFLRPTINTRALIYGGQMFALRFLDTAGATVTTPWRSVYGDGTNNTPTEFGYAGPFYLGKWDGVSDVDVLLSSVRDISASSLTGPLLVSGATVYSQLDQMFSIYAPDPAGLYRDVKWMESGIVFSSVGYNTGEGADPYNWGERIGTMCRQFAKGYGTELENQWYSYSPTDDWSASWIDFSDQTYDKLTELAYTLTAAQLTASVVEETILNRTTGADVLGEVITCNLEYPLQGIFSNQPPPTIDINLPYGGRNYQRKWTTANIIRNPGFYYHDEFGDPTSWDFGGGMAEGAGEYAEYTPVVGGGFVLQEHFDQLENGVPGYLYEFTVDIFDLAFDPTDQALIDATPELANFKVEIDTFWAAEPVEIDMSANGSKSIYVMASALAPGQPIILRVTDPTGVGPYFRADELRMYPRIAAQHKIEGEVYARGANFLENIDFSTQETCQTTGVPGEVGNAEEVQTHVNGLELNACTGAAATAAGNILDNGVLSQPNIDMTTTMVTGSGTFNWRTELVGEPLNDLWF